MFLSSSYESELTYLRVIWLLKFQADTFIFSILIIIMCMLKEIIIFILLDYILVYCFRGYVYNTCVHM